MKKILSALLIITLLVLAPIYALAEFEIITSQSEGTKVILVQKRLRDLGYLNYRSTGTYGTLTRIAVTSFQAKHNIMADGSIGEETFNLLFSKESVRAPMNATLRPISGPGNNGSVSTRGQELNWSTSSNIFPVGTQAKITDLNSNIKFTMKRTGGTNNAWVEPVTASDNAEYLKAFGNGSSYEKRAVLVEINGTVYAGSLFGWPHGQDAVPENSMQGHTNLFFHNSTSDVLGLEDSEHKNQISRATKTG